MMTAHGSLDITIEAIKRGAFYYLEKPFAFEQVLILARRALEFKAIKAESRLQKTSRAQDRDDFGIIGNNVHLRGGEGLCGSTDARR